MLKKVFITVFILMFGCTVYSQNFTFVPDHTSLTGTAGEEVVFDIPLVNTSNLTLTLYVKRTVDSLPENWFSSMCFDEACFPPFLDSVATTEEYNSAPVAPGETVDFSLHIFCDTITTGTAHVRLVAGETRGGADTIGVDLFVTVNPVSVKDGANPHSYSLKQNYPNPFNPSTIIEFSIASASNVKLDVFNLNGEKVKSVLNKEMNSGNHKIKFDASGLPSGLYFYRLSAGSFVQTNKMILLR